MKAYILDSINRFKRFSESLDVATTLSNKTWTVFNDSGERELYIFQTDGTVIITKDGVGIKGQWQWLPANQSLIISQDESVIMLHPQYIDNNILALQLDGKNETVFLIDEVNHLTFAPRTLTQLQLYFEKKAQQVIVSENDAEEKSLQIAENENQYIQMTQEERERAEFRHKVEEEKRQQKEKEKNDKEWNEWLIKETEEVNQKLGKPILPQKETQSFNEFYDDYWSFPVGLGISGLISITYFFVLRPFPFGYFFFLAELLLSLLLYLCILGLLWIFYRINKPKKEKYYDEKYKEDMERYNTQYKEYKIKRAKWIEEHPNDPRIKYLMSFPENITET